jgi:hypothetical protein
MKSEYLDLRRRYQPEELRLIIVAESPPASGRYFYNPPRQAHEYLFDAFMKQLRVPGSDKEAGLRELQRRGWLPVDATYQQVDKQPDGKRQSDGKRNAILRHDYPQLRDDLAALTPDKSIPVIVIKVNVWQVVRPLLIGDGFNVINDTPIPFPSHSNQPEFHERFTANLMRAAITVE